MILPLAFPGLVAGSIFTFSLTLGDYIIPYIIGTSRLFIGQAVYIQQGTAGNIPLAAAFSVVPIVIMAIYLTIAQAPGGVRCALRPAPGARLGLKLAAAAGLLFLHLPMAFILLYAFTTDDKSYQFPPPGLTLHWFAVAWERAGHLERAVAVGAGRAWSRPRWRWCSARSPPPRCTAPRFFGREAITLLIILPIALPGIVTGIALRSTFNLLDIPFSFWTIVVGHATFCIVVVYNNVLARFRRTSGSI